MALPRSITSFGRVLLVVLVAFSGTVLSSSTPAGAAAATCGGVIFQDFDSDGSRVEDYSHVSTEYAAVPDEGVAGVLITLTDNGDEDDHDIAFLSITSPQGSLPTPSTTTSTITTTVPPTTAPPNATTVPPRSSPLAFTGGTVVPLVLSSLLLILTGALFAGIGRGRRGRKDG